MKIVAFVVAVLYSLEDKWRGIGLSASFEYIVSRSKYTSLHSAWFKLYKEGLLGEFLADFSDFDPLFGTSATLNRILAKAFSYGWIRLGGTDLCYHLDVLKPDEILRFLKMYDIQVETVEKTAVRLNALLDEQEKAATPPTQV